MTLHGNEGYCIVLHGMERNAWYSVVLLAIDLCSITMNGAWYCKVSHGVAKYNKVLHGATGYCMVLLGITC